MANQAAWMKQKHATLEVGEADKYEPDAGELLVKVEIIAFSPIEAKIQKFATFPMAYPNILGMSYAGTVEQIGAGVTNFQSGDPVAVLRPQKKSDDSRFGAFQKYALASAFFTSKLSKAVPLEDGATTIVNLAAITCALNIHLELDPPSLSGQSEPKGKKVLIYGGSSATGSLATRYAVTAGYETITTSSPAHRAFVEKLGVAHVIDHTLAPDDLLQELQKHGPYDAIFDSIGIPPVTNLLYDYLASVGGGSYNSLLPLLGGEKPAPEDVEKKFASYSWALEEEEHEEGARWFFEKYVPQGLETGLVVPTRAKVVEGGLENIQHALDLLNDNKVSGYKLVLYPWGREMGA